MKQYDSYKDSGISWIGKIPSHWEQCRLKSYNSLKGRIGWNGLRSEEFLTEGYAYLVTGQDFSGRDIKWEKCYQIDKFRYEEDPFIQLNNGDLLITKDGTIGKIATVRGLDKPACLNSGIFVMKQTSDKYDQGYLFWLLSSDILKEFNNYTSSGTTILHLYQNVFENMPMVVPPINEQIKISDYLDKKCVKVDEVLAFQEKRICLLEELKRNIITTATTRGLSKNVEFKDTGADWIGKYPSHWEYKKFNLVCSCITDFVASGSFADLRENVNYLSEPDYAMLVRTVDLSDSAKDTAKVYISKESYDFLSNSNLYGGEVILPNVGSVGSVFMMPENLYPKMSLAPNAIMFRTKMNNKFFFYFFSGFVGNKILCDMAQATTLAKFNKTDLRGAKVLVPPIDEQNQIVEYLDARCQPIDNAIEQSKFQIEKLKQYKQSLITEVVTGKRKIC